MPGKIKVKVLAGRNLPVMDRSGDTTDAYVELKFGNITYKTDVCRKSLNPQWNSEWYRFEVDDAELQDEPLQIRLMDHDTYSANDAIGKVYVNLNPLLLPGVPPTVKNMWTLEASMNTNAGSQSGSVMTGWIPVFDTMHGIRGEVSIIVKVELFSDFNKFRQSSCGVQFFYSPNIPYGYHAQNIHGFVEELIVSDDPEYKWIDKIRTPRASNEARQTLFFKLSGEVQRKIGLKALDLGGNAVIGYLQNFDLEGESGIVARGIGTAVTLVKAQDALAFTLDKINSEEVPFAFFSQSKGQRECAGLEDITTPLSVTPNPNPDSLDNPFDFSNASRTPKYSGESWTHRYDDLQKDASTSQDSQKLGGLKKCAVSYASLSESVIQDESIRMMLALEDVRGEGNKNKWDVRVKNLKKIFATNDGEITAGSNPRLSLSGSVNLNPVRSSIASIYSSKKEKIMKTNNKASDGMAALLIKSIHSVQLDHVTEDHETSHGTNEATEHLQESTGLEDAEKSSHEEQQEDRQDSACEIESNAENIYTTYASSVEGTTTSSENDNISNDSARYDVLRDSNFSTDEESEASRHSSSLTRAFSFPLTKFRPPREKFRRIDSDARPLHKESSSFSLVKCLSANPISYNMGLDFHPKTDDTIFISQKKEDELQEDVSKLAKDEDSSPEISKQKFHQTIWSELTAAPESGDDSLPLATSTPEEIRAPFFSEKENLEVKVLIEENDEVPYIDENTSEVVESTEKLSSSIEQKQFPQFDEASTITRARGSLKFIKHSEHKDLYDRILTISAHSLPSLHESELEYNESENLSDKEIREVALDTPSSIESLIDSSSNNELFDPQQNTRRNRMLDLIKIIDTKMMVHDEHHTSNSNGRAKRRRRERMHKNFDSSTNLQKHLQQQFLRRHLERCESTEFMRVSSYPKDLSLNESSAPVSVILDSSSCKSSLESIISLDRDTLIRSRLNKLTDSSESKRSFPISESALDPRPTHEITKELTTVDTQSSSSLRSNSNDKIEMMELKPIDNTNNFTSDAFVGRAIQRSRSTCNVRKVSHQDEFTNKTNTANITYNSCVSRPSPDHRQQQDEASLTPSYPLPAVSPVVSKVCQSPVTKAQPVVSLHRRSSDSDLSITPKGNSLGTSEKSTVLKTSIAVIRTMNQDALEMLEYPFITTQHYPPGFVIHIGGLVSSRSVKLLERISNLEEPEGRDGWWKEIRMEIRSHARALACNVVIGYREETSICDDVCVLNAYGTAAVINLHKLGKDAEGVFSNKIQAGSVTAPADLDREKSQQKQIPIKTEKSETEAPAAIATHQTGKVRHMSECKDHEMFNTQFQTKCNLCHLPYNESSVPFRVSVSKCGTCKRAKVPDVMFTTIELPENMLTTGRGCIIQATVCKSKKDLRGELNAKEISDCLPFLEYELHSLLLNKLKVKGMNGIFGLKLQVSVGERLIIGMAVGTAVFLTSLPSPSIPQIASGNSWTKEEQLADIRKTLVETVKKNREFHRLKPIVDLENGHTANTSDTDESEEDLPDLDFSVGTRDTCVLEVDDIEDMDRISLLMDDRPPDDFHVVNTQSIPGLDDLEIVRNLQMFTQISRAKIPAGQFASMPSKYFAKLLQSVYFKLRRMVPCALCDMQFKLAIPEPDEIQFTVIGMALGLGDPIKINKPKKKLMSHSVSKDQVKRSDDSDMIFSLDVEHTEAPVDPPSLVTNPPTLTCTPGAKFRSRSPLRLRTNTMHRHKHVPLKGRYGVDITPLSYLPGGRIERYLGNLNFFFIRESTSIRENGGLSGFTHSFVTEVLAIVRAHITALGGNAMVSFFMTKCVLFHSPHKNQGQCLINVGGDVVSVSYFADEKHSGTTNC